MRDTILQWLREQKLQGTDDYLIPKHQIVLMGGNSLPVRVVLQALGMEHAVIIATDKVWKIPGPQLQEQAKKFNCKVEVEIIRSPWEEHEITTACERAREKLGNRSVGLHYTAGTKPMSAHAHTWWRLNCSPDGRAKHQCTYLDSGDGLVFDGLSIAFPDIKNLRDINLEDIVSLHGMCIKTAGHRQDDAIIDAVAKAIFQDKSFSHPDGGAHDAYWKAIPGFYGIKLELPLTDDNVRSAFSRYWTPDASTDPGQSPRIILEDARTGTDKNFKSSRVYSTWSLDPLRGVLGDVISKEATSKTLLEGVTSPEKLVQYFTTGWFEDWLANRIENIQEIKQMWVNYELEAFEKGLGTEKTELDIVARKGYSAVLISCTIDDKAHVKHKAFEALHRAGQLGGDHTRFILASWIKDNAKLSKLWQELALHWDGGKRFRVLGWKHYLGEAAYTHTDAKGNSCLETIEQMFEEWFK